MKTLTLFFWFLMNSSMYGENLIPPSRYDHAYDGEVIVSQISTEPRLREICQHFGVPLRSTSVVLACAFVHRDRCYIFSVPEKDLETWGASVKMVLKHERAHCNGWPANHPR